MLLRPSVSAAHIAAEVAVAEAGEDFVADGAGRGGDGIDRIASADQVDEAAGRERTGRPRTRRR